MNLFFTNINISRIWESYGVKVVISTANIKTQSGCAQLIQEALKLGPVGGVFSVSLRSGNEIKDFDELTRKLCPKMQYFVVFNDYGMVNSIVKQTIELRHNEGLPAKLIEWSAADRDEDKTHNEISYNQCNKMSCCLNNMDYLMTTNEPIVAKLTVDVKIVKEKVKESLNEAVLRIMSIKDNRSISMHSTMAELGLNSLTTVELRETLERDYDIILTTKNLTSLTIDCLEKLTNK